MGLASSQSGAVLQLALGFADGTPPVAAAARVAWVAEPCSTGDDARTFGLCFVDVPTQIRERLEAAVDARQEAPVEPPVPEQDARVRLDHGPVLRAKAESYTSTGAIIGAELPWLRLGAAAQGELGGASFHGRISWVGLDVAASGVARLRVRIAFDADAAGERRDVTLPYFSTEAARAELPAQVDDAARDDEGNATGVGWIEDRSKSSTPPRSEIVVAASANERANATGRAHALVQIGARRRQRLAILRASVAVLTLVALFLLARLFLRPMPPVEATAAPAPIVVHPAAEIPASAIESERAPAIEEPAPSPEPAVRKATKAKPHPKKAVAKHLAR